MQPLINLKSFLAALLILVVSAALLVAYFRNYSPEAGDHPHSATGKSEDISVTKPGGHGHAAMGNSTMPETQTGKIQRQQQGRPSQTATAHAQMEDGHREAGHERRDQASNVTSHGNHEHPPGPGLLGQPPEYVHVLLNHLPVYGLGIAVLALGAALLARSRPAQTLALGIVVVTSAMAWPVQYFGENAYQRVRQISDEDGQQRLDEHMERADKFIYAFYATALLAIAALISQKKFPKATTPLVVVTLFVGSGSLGAGVWISKAGGEIRHPEFRAKSAQPQKAAPHKHGAPEQSHEKMQHEKTQPSDTSGGHKHGEMPKQAAEKIPLPDTLEGVWKAIHEHHGQLESAVTGKKFSDVQSHAEQTRALTKQLVELSHADHKPVVESGVNKVNETLDALKQSAETGSELVLKNNFTEFGKALNELEQQMKKQ